jgi:hypothetical protein
MTTYVILFKEANEDDYGVLKDRVDAASTSAAVRVAAGNVQRSGMYVAIPARSFDPVNIAIDTTPRVQVVR